MRPLYRLLFALSFSITASPFMATPAHAEEPASDKTDKTDKKARTAEAAPNALTPNAQTIERIVAVVNNTVILLSEVKERGAQIGQTIDDTGTADQRRLAQKQLRQVLDRMVDDELILQQATELKLSVEEAEVDQAVEEVRRTNHLDAAQFQAALTEQGYTTAGFRKDMRKQILRLKTINTAVRSRLNITEEDVKAFYEQNARQSGGHRQAHVRHVMIAVAAGADPKTVEKKRAVAVKVLEDARGGADFALLAKTHSDDASTKDEGGDLGWVKEGEGLSEALSEVIFSMEQKNEVRGPIKTDRGFEVLQLLERREGDVRPYSEVKDQLRSQLTTQQIEKQTATWIQELRKKAHVDVRL